MNKAATDHPRRIAVLGGTGHLGYALARRWALAGHQISLGSRDAERAQASATKLAQDTGAVIASGTNRDVVENADIAVLTVPFASQASVLCDVCDLLAGKLLVDTTVPLVPPKVMRVQLPPEGSAAVRAKALVGEAVQVVSAFHSVAAHKLVTDQDVQCDVLVFGDDREARGTVVGLARDAGMRGLHGGALCNSAAAEAMTSVLIFLNKTYAVDGAGLLISGALTESAA